MHPAHLKTEKDYQEIRDKVIKDANFAMHKKGASLVNFRHIDSAALAHAKRWEDWEDNNQRHDDATWLWSKGFRS